MKKLLFTLVLIAGAVSVTLIYSCKKSDNTTTTTTPSGTTLDANDQTFNNDANNYKTESDNSNNDVNTMISSSSMQERLPQGSSSLQSSWPCGASIDSSQIGSNILKFNFDSTVTCYFPTRNRSGQIVVQLTGTKWSDAGAVLTFTYNNYKVKYSNGSSIMFNGAKTLKNVNGTGFLAELAFLYGDTTFKFQERAIGINVSFGNGLTATWNSANTTQWSYDTTAKLIYFKANGDTAVGGFTGVCNWGINRFAQAFITHLTSSIICNSNCGYGKPMSGQWIHNINTYSLTVTYGVNSDGSPYTGTSCPWGFNVAWQLPSNNGNANFWYGW